VALAVETGTMPSQWFAELERDEATVATALDILTKASEQQGKRPADSDGRQMSG
jgi:hypothetical protein